MEKADRAMGPPPIYTGQDATKFNNLPSLLTLCRQQNISPFFGSQLHILQEYTSIRIVIDDSGSMRTSETDGFGRAAGTRWDELLVTLRSVFDIACAAATTGSTNPNDPTAAGSAGGAAIDVYLLNGHADGRKQFLGLRSYAELEGNLVGLPVRGRTPTLECLQDLFHYERMQGIGELPVLTAIFTDGQPDSGIPAFSQFLQHVQHSFGNSFVTISLCTGDESVVAMYNSLDVGIPRVDVMDDYKSERSEIVGIQGRRFPFSKSDYLVKMLLGSRVALWDSLDERKLSKQQRKMFEDYSAAAFGTSGKNSSKGDCIIS